jgi:7-cyano-7-deazaguanine synthase in queuosine biosynthesis
MIAYQYNFAAQGQFNRTPWLDKFRINVEGRERLLTQHLGNVERDLLDVAMAVYVADRISRRSPEHPDDWFVRMTGRSLKLHIPVRKERIWNDPEVKRLLTDALEYLTADEWEIVFEERTSHTHQQTALFSAELKNPFVGLFSGGLDSFAGAVSQAFQPEFETGILVSAYSNPSLVSRQRKLVAEMNTKLKSNGKSLLDLHLSHNLHYGVKHNPAAPILPELRGRDEVTQRSRGFLFVAMGLAVTRSVGLDTLNVYENGVGAINLPHTMSGLGVDYTRAMHPEFLHRMMLLASSVFEAGMRIENPSLWKTKGQMCREIAEHGFEEMAVKTISCDGFPRRKPHAHEQCGRCTSCLLRRVSLAAGGLEELDRSIATYQTDVYSVVPTSKNTDALFELRCMEHQVVRIKNALARGNPETSLLTEFPELLRARAAIARTEGRPIEVITGELIGLFRRYVSDWDWFSSFLPNASTVIAVS